MPSRLLVRAAAAFRHGATGARSALLCAALLAATGAAPAGAATGTAPAVAPPSGTAPGPATPRSVPPGDEAPGSVSARSPGVTQEPAALDAGSHSAAVRSRMLECAHQWSARKRAGTATGTWKQFAKTCLPSS